MTATLPASRPAIVPPSSGRDSARLACSLVTIHDLLIGGVHRQSSDGATFTVYEPATGRPLAEVAQATVADVADAVGAAHRAFEEGAWPRVPASQRGRVLANVAALIRERSAELSELESRNGGKPIGGAEWEVGNCRRPL